MDPVVSTLDHLLFPTTVTCFVAFILCQRWGLVWVISVNLFSNALILDFVSLTVELVKDILYLFTVFLISGIPFEFFLEVPSLS